MTLESRLFLNTIGYEIDKKGNITSGMNQIAIVSLENDPYGGILRIHGSDDQFFYSGDPLLEEKELFFPSKITARYVYFQGKNEAIRVESKEFIDNALKAFFEFTKLTGRKIAG
jgi:hypothetical protein